MLIEIFKYMLNLILFYLISGLTAWAGLILAHLLNNLYYLYMFFGMIITVPIGWVIFIKLCERMEL